MYKVSMEMSNKELFLKKCQIVKGVQTGARDASGHRMAKDCPL